MATVVLLGVAVVGITAVALLVWWLKRRREAALRSPPPLLFHLAPPSGAAPAARAAVRPAFYTPPSTSPAILADRAPLPPRLPVPADRVARPPLAPDTPIDRFVVVEPRRENAVNGNGNGNGAAHHHAPIPAISHSLDEPIDGGETIRFVRPGEQAVQLLPGRLEVLAGTTQLREIRFVRLPGEQPHLIVGRDPGPSPHHVGLGSATVSRRHARFDYSADRTWSVRNLSRTNPLVVNEMELSETDPPHPLSDGDRLELGEVVLRFHAR
jgi:hypothetical protein